MSNETKMMLNYEDIVALAKTADQHHVVIDITVSRTVGQVEAYDTMVFTPHGNRAEIKQIVTGDLMENALKAKIDEPISQGQDTEFEG